MGKHASLARFNRIVEECGNDRKRLVKELKRLIREGRETGDAILIGAAYRQLAIINARQGRREEMLSNALKAVALLKDCDDHVLVAKAYNVLGYAYDMQENNQMALVNYDKAYRLVKKHRIRDQIRIFVLNNLATCYHTMGDCGMSIKLLNECLKETLLETPDNYSDLAMYSINLADCHRDLGEQDQAREILEQMAEWVDKVDAKLLACDYYLRRALLAYEQGERELGEKCVDDALSFVGQFPDAYQLYEDFRQVQHILVSGGEWERAEKINEIMLAYAKNNPDTIDQLIACRALADFYGGKGDYTCAEEYYEQLCELYEKRLSELKEIQLSVHKTITDAEAEINKLNLKIKEGEELAGVEPLTKLLNRTALLKTATEFIELAEKKKEKVGAIFIDIDYFKECNDTYGHTKGDEILRVVADACRKEEKARVRFARYGGDELFGITRGLMDDEVVDIARRICERIREADIPNGKNPNGHRVTLSVGVVNVVITERTNTIIDIANYADKAVYHAKDAGRNMIYLLDHGRVDENGRDAPFVKIDF